MGGCIKKISTIQERVKLKQQELEKWRSIAECLTPKLGIRSGYTKSDKVGNCIISIVTLEKELEDQISELVAEYTNVTRLINDLEDESEKLLLEYRYLNGKTWEDISELMGYDLRYIFKKHSNALERIKKRH